GKAATLRRSVANLSALRGIRDDKTARPHYSTADCVVLSPFSTGGRLKMHSFGSLAVLLIAAIAPAAILGAPPAVPSTGPPPTLYNLDRKIRFISLAEARAVALEQGKVGQPSLLFPGVGLDNVVTPRQSESSNPAHVVCKSGSKGLILTGVR